MFDKPRYIDPGSPIQQMWSSGGITLRDFYAGLAMAGMTANPACDKFGDEELACLAFAQADVMLSVREEKV